MSELTGLRDALKGQLSGRQDISKLQEDLTTGVLAAKIKALKAANTLESAVPRSERKQTAAEEPVTARIRPKQEEASAGLDSSGALTSGSRPQPISFQERILRERQQMS